MERPTFSESWYRVGKLHPRLRSTVQVYRQHFRGQMWHVVQDPGSNQFSRLNEPAYVFVAMLDGRRTVAEVWRICNEKLGDAAPTQGEAIQLLGQLYASNLLQAELPPDAESLFKRYHKRVRREVKSYLSNFLFIRIPLIDPDAFLDKALPLIRWVYSWIGFALWLGLMAVGGYFVIGNLDALVARGKDVFRQANLAENLPLLYLSFVLVKVCHEFSHSFSCKKFGRQQGSGGEVHVMGVMFLVFTPLPYMDASSAWAFRSKWHRVIVGAAGMFVELGIAAVAMVVWASTGSGTVNEVAYNVIFIASVSTLLFNGNPLLRYDAYYILSDLLEIPNLAHRSREYVKYLIKRYAWGVRHARNPGHTVGERVWLAFYGVASTLYRVFILTVIILFLTNRLPDAMFVVGAVLGIVAAITWLGVPVVKFIYYLATNAELSRVRLRAAGSSFVVVAAILSALWLIPAPDRTRVEGVIEPARSAFVHTEAPGFVKEFLPSGRDVRAGEKLLRMVNMEIQTRDEQLLAHRRRLEAHRRLAKTRDIATAQNLAKQIAALDEQIEWNRQRLEALVVRAPFDGKWISPQVERLQNAYLQQGEIVGQVVSKADPIIVAAAGQNVAAVLFTQARRRVEIRLKGCPNMELGGEKIRMLPAGKHRLPSAALAAPAGGTIAATADGDRGLRAVERLFEIHVAPDRKPDVPLLLGQRVVVRFRMPDTPLLAQLWRAVRQLFHRRFHV